MIFSIHQTRKPLQEKCDKFDMVDLQRERNKTSMSQEESIWYIQWQTHKLKMRRIKQAIRNTHEDVQSTKEQQ